MTLAQLDAFVQDRIEHDPRNCIDAETAIEPGCTGLRIYDPPLFGVCSADDTLFLRFKEPGIVGPQYISPTEWLPTAKSVISFFLPFSEQVRLSNRIHPRDASPEWQHARIEGQQFLSALSELLAAFIRSAGFSAVVPSNDPRFHAIDDRAAGIFTSNWSERHAAYACGLGTFGLSAGLITARGVAGRFGSLVTDLPFPASPRPYSGVYDYCSFCGKCAINCPANAIDPQSGKKHRPCSAFMQETMVKFFPRYGCGKCQTAVPCEAHVPHKKSSQCGLKYKE